MAAAILHQPDGPDAAADDQIAVCGGCLLRHDLRVAIGPHVRGPLIQRRQKARIVRVEPHSGITAADG